MGIGFKELERILCCASDTGISDVHCVEGEHIYWRRDGVLVPLRDYIPSGKDMYNFFLRIADEDKWGDLLEKKVLDLGWNNAGRRYRIHIYSKMNRMAFAIRILPANIPPIGSLGQACMVKSFSASKQGLLLITGATGSGKSTTAAAFLQEIAKETEAHIMTLEDPIEFILAKGKSMISQMELGKDFLSYDQGMKAAMRQDPDIIMVSELRDGNTIHSVLDAALSGHFVIATMHAGSTAEALERIITSYPADQQSLARVMLATALVGVCSQKLLPNKQGRRQCAMEVLKGNNAIRNLIRQGKFEQLQGIMQTSSQEGMQTMAGAIEKLLEKKYYPDVALASYTG